MGRSKMKNKTDIQFISTIPNLSYIEECLPKPSNKFIPDWWKNLPAIKPINGIDESIVLNVKSCPAFPDYFSQGFIVPMWADTVLFYDEDSDVWKWRSSFPNSNWTNHLNEQFIISAKPNIFENIGKFVFKTNSPWNLITPPGYSVLQLPVFYHFNPDISVVPGVLATDVRHELNLQLIFHSNKKEIFIERGTPLVQYIPFKRNNFLKLNVRDATNEDNKFLSKSVATFDTTFSKGKEYLKLRRNKDKEINKHE